MLTGLLLVSLLLPMAQEPAQARPVSSSIHGTTTTQESSVVLPGVEIVLRESHSTEIAPTASAVTDDSGRFALEDLSPGSYRITASLPGFLPISRDQVVLQAGESIEVLFDLSISTLEQTVEVIGNRDRETLESGSSTATLKADLVNTAPVKGDSFQALLPLLPGVLRAADGRIVMSGGRATQSGLVLNSSTNVTDPATGGLGFSLPSEAIESVEVLANPYSAEFGRFSSGVTNLLTRQGSRQWKFRANNFLPRGKIRDNAFMGIAAFTPRLNIRGPLVKDRLFLAQTVQYRIVKTRIPGLPPLEADRRLESFDSFTQLDLNLGPRHSLSSIVSFYPRKLDFNNLDTFNPIPVTANFHRRGYNVGFTERTILTSQAVLESTLSFKRLDADIFGQGQREMDITPDTNAGNFFHTERRKTRTIQWVENMSLNRSGWAGDHLFKFGLDLLHSAYDGENQTRSVNIFRADKTLTERIEFSAPASQRVRATDVALFAQDRWRLHERLLLELGVRLDHDDVLSDTHASPRFGFVLDLGPEDSVVLRGGAGIFYDRTPLKVGAFESLETRTVTRFSEDGTTPVGAPQAFHLRSAESLRTPYSFTWNIEYDQRLGPRILVKAKFLRRNGFHEFLVEPLERSNPSLRVNSRGRSRYWELELSAYYSLGDESDLAFTYVRSRARQDLNAFDEFFGNAPNPIIRPNQFSLANTDVPNRFLLRGTLALPGDWHFSPVLEVREGFPYSLINQDREFIGQRNQGQRFPFLTSLDIDIRRPFKIGKWKVRMGFRVFNALNQFNPRDIQNNIDAARFGVFSNQIPRRFGGTLQIDS